MAGFGLRPITQLDPRCRWLSGLLTSGHAGRVLPDVTPEARRGQGNQAHQRWPRRVSAKTKKTLSTGCVRSG